MIMLLFDGYPRMKKLPRIDAPADDPAATPPRLSTSMNACSVLVPPYESMRWNWRPPSNQMPRAFLSGATNASELATALLDVCTTSTFLAPAARRPFCPRQSGGYTESPPAV